MLKYQITRDQTELAASEGPRLRQIGNAKAHIALSYSSLSLDNQLAGEIESSYVPPNLREKWGVLSGSAAQFQNIVKGEATRE